jgi:hypothetical protein
MATNDSRGKFSGSSVAEVCRLLGDAAGTGWGPTLRLALLLIVIAGCYLIVRGIAS